LIAIFLAVRITKIEICALRLIIQLTINHKKNNTQ